MLGTDRLDTRLYNETPVLIPRACQHVTFQLGYYLQLTQTSTVFQLPDYCTDLHKESFIVRSGGLKMREWKMRYEQNCRGGKCRSRLYGTPNQDYIEKILSYVELENAGADHMAYKTATGFFICLIRLDIATLCTKFDSSSLSRSLDMG